MAEEVDLSKDQDIALEAAWKSVGAKLASIPPSKFDDGPAPEDDDDDGEPVDDGDR